MHTHLVVVGVPKVHDRNGAGMRRLVVPGSIRIAKDDHGVLVRRLNELCHLAHVATRAVLHDRDDAESVEVVEFGKAVDVVALPVNICIW